MNYIGIKCPVCEKEFKESDDIVVCPSCGAPYHRECYAQTGHCVFEGSHGTPDAWKPPEAKSAAGSEPKRCPRCGRENGATSLFCDHCGMSLMQGDENDPYAASRRGVYPPPPPSSPYPPQPQQPGVYTPGGQSPISFYFDPLGGVKAEEPFDGVTAGELAKLVQNNTGYYIPVFTNQHKFRRSRFNFCAFLFTGGWMLYRKMYKLGVLFSLLTMGLWVASSIVTSQVIAPILVSTMQQLGMDTTTATMDDLMKVSQKLMEEPSKAALFVLLPMLLWAAQLAVMLVSGLMANKFYMKHCIRKVKAIQASAPEENDRILQFQTQGGVNTTLAIVLLILCSFLSLLPQISMLS